MTVEGPKLYFASGAEEVQIRRLQLTEALMRSQALLAQRSCLRGMSVFLVQPEASIE